jgi:asparagine synthase (glutamine-hydrolysing)
MSAIVGLFYRDGRTVEPAELEQMVNILAHRGPDGAGIWSEGPIGLGHRMLYTTPESLHERMPLTNEITKLAITADARLDNREELIRTLGLDTVPAIEITDSQLILSAYERWGEQCPTKLLGDFAFAIWDGHRQTLFCAQDHFGVKSLFYFVSERVFICATEIKAILCLCHVPRRLNEARIADHLMLGTYSEPSLTYYQDIQRLLPAHALMVDGSRLQLHRYWSLDPTHEVRLNSNEEYAQALLEIFTEAIRCRLRSAYPVGSMLSGGLDSSSIACVAKQLVAQDCGQPLPTFSATFDQVPQSNERPYIQTVVDMGNFAPNYIEADQISPLSSLDSMLWHADEPFSAGNLYLNWHLYDLARGQGVRVLLDGFDGDTTVSHGRGYLRELALAGRWWTLATELQECTRKAQGPSWQRVLWRYMVTYNGLLKRTRQAWHTVHHPARFDHQVGESPFLNADFARRIHLSERHQSVQKSFQTEREDHLHLLNRPVMADILKMLDWAAGAFSTELRFPFYDKRLVEFCLALPPQQKLNQGWNRVVLRRAMTGILPAEVQWRGSKTNVGLGFTHGLLTFERDRLKQALFERHAVIEPYINLVAIREAYNRLFSQRARSGDAHVVWKAGLLIRWLQHSSSTP